MLDGKTPLELALEREAESPHPRIDYCDECEYARVVLGTGYCGISGKLLHPMMYERGQGCGPARGCRKREEALNMGLSSADLARLGPAAQRQILNKLGQIEQAKQTKYHNEPDSRGSIRFDSKKEARRYDELMVMLKAGQIRNLRLQQQFTLQESYVTPEGERVRAIRYVADFAYEQKRLIGESGTHDPIGVQEIWLPVVEDVKSKATRTAQYEMKKKLLRERHNITIVEV